MVELTDQQATLLQLLHQRASWERITDTLEMARQAVHDTPLKALTRKGLVPPRGALPDGATGATVPSARTAAAFAEFAVAQLPRLTGGGWTTESAAGVMEELARVGTVPPPAPDERYTGAQWSGETLRRVGWVQGRTVWIVQSQLLADPSGLPWSKATPRWRHVAVWDDPLANTPVSWWHALRGGVSGTGGMWCPVGEVRSELPGLPESSVAGMTMCVAWVLEARAVLDQAALEASDA